MEQFTLLASPLVMGVVLVTIALAVSSLGQRRSRAVATDGGQPTVGPLRRAAGDPIVWSVGFLLLSAAAIGGALLFVTGWTVPGLPSSFGTILLGLLAATVIGYLFWGVYHSSRYRGLHRPAALAVAVWTAGLFFVLGIVLRLLEIV